METSDALLLQALRAAPRRYRLPPLPRDAQQAAAADAETAVAFAIEALRRGAHDARVEALFTAGLEDLIRAAMAAEGGDPGFQALVLRARDPQVDEHVRLAMQATADRRAVRSTVDAIAHPGKLRGMAPGPLRNALAHLHASAEADDWTELRAAATQLLAGEPLRGALESLLAQPALERLERALLLRTLPSVQRFDSLCAQRGPLAGSDAAAAQGRASARAGGDAEALTVDAFRAIASLLQQRSGAPHRVLRGLRTPRGFPGAGDGAKAEWDAAIVRGEDIVLLAEVKASPAAVNSDFLRLLRGLQGLAQADGHAIYDFPSADGEVRIAGASLQRLQPHGAALPPHVIYCCSAPAEPQPQMLSASAKGVLLTDPACIAFAAQLAAGAAPSPEMLAPVWQALPGAARLRPVLLQDDSARQAREAMLQPQDLLGALAQLVP